MTNPTIKKERNSNIELYRIITMFVIVAHHYVVNSGVYPAVIESGNCLSFKSLFYLLFGWCGKTAINCFLLITGYYMCTSKIKVNKFVMEECVL